MFIKVNNLSKSFKIFKRDAGLKGAFRSFFKRNYHQFIALNNINLDIDKGEIIDQGSHDELINRDGIYKQLHNLQFQT